jgi:ParB-like chromosome segregation protein Spo0J
LKPFKILDKHFKKQELFQERRRVMPIDLIGQNVINKAKALFSELELQDESAKVETINELRKLLHKHSPFSGEPVDFVQWILIDQVEANDYNPNQVAPPEMKLLEHSIQEDGYTQPMVVWNDEENHYEVVDGFHRYRVGKESKIVSKRIKGYLPVVVINTKREKRGDRIASTIRHNRARGKHRIDGMANIVLELKRRNWSSKKIGKELGMDPDEVLRLSQITGLAEMFADRDFSNAWEAELINETDNLEINEENIDDDSD